MEAKEKLALLAKLNTTYKFDSLNLSAVNLEISPKDSLFRQGEERHYFNVGFSGLQCITEALSCAQKDIHEIKQVLDFASGYGRVLRFIKAYFPEAQISACEIKKDALKFCSERFGVNAIESQEDFERVDVKQKFDLIWCGSLFTHINKARFVKLLRFFTKILAYKGVLIFTTLGSYAYQLLASKERDYHLSRLRVNGLLLQYRLLGYGYVKYSIIGRWGLAIVNPSWVGRLLEKRIS